jgi:hypothetical protein
MWIKVHDYRYYSITFLVIYLYICFAVDVQEEIDCLYEFVPEVEQHFEVIDKIGEGISLLCEYQKLIFTKC